jgi:POT family proton-dependent oligopeptide transporter
MALGSFMMPSSRCFTVRCPHRARQRLFLPSLPSSAPYPPETRAAFAHNICGVNLGGFLAPLVCGTLGELYGWHYGFAAAGVGMLSGLAIYILGGRHLPPDPPRAANAAAHAATHGERRQLFLLLAIIGCAVVVSGAYEQVGNTVALWADQGVDRAVGPGFSVPMTWSSRIHCWYSC